jgi:hypothetical protein
LILLRLLAVCRSTLASTHVSFAVGSPVVDCASESGRKTNGGIHAEHRDCHNCFGQVRGCDCDHSTAGEYSRRTEGRYSHDPSATPEAVTVPSHKSRRPGNPCATSLRALPVGCSRQLSRPPPRPCGPLWAWVDDGT